MPGTLVFRPIEANLNVKDQDTVGKMDPYVLFHVGTHRVKSQVCQSGGQNPHWNDSVSCQFPEHGGIVKVDVKDKDMLIDDKLGSFELDLNEVASLGQVRKWYPIFSKDRPAGEILIETTFNGSGQGQGFVQQGHSNQQFVGVPTHGHSTQQYSGVHQGHTTQQFGGIPQQGHSTQFVGVPTQGHTTQHFSGVPTTQSTYVQGGTHIPQTQHTTQHVSHQNVPLQSNQPLHYSGQQANVLPVGGVPTSTEQYAVEALMRGVDPMNSQQHYQYNVANGSTNPGFSGIPMNYSSAGQSTQQNPTTLTQTPLYSGSQPLLYQGEESNATKFANTHSTGHHNQGLGGNTQLQGQPMGQSLDQQHHHPVQTKNLNTGDFRNV